MKSVCIVGAGPAGLVAAKTFLQTGAFEVTVYEKSKRLGGIWALDEDSKGGYLGPKTPTNLSRFTVSFSDLAWSSVDVNGKSNNTSQKVPMFPKAWQVNRYLEAYRKKYIPAEMISYRTEVVMTNSYRKLEKGSPHRWKVTTRRDGQEEVRVFDHVIIASGFFSQARPLGQDVKVDGDLLVKGIHSSEFRTLDDLFSTETSPLGKNILLIGGGNSAGEAAAAVASQLSNARWSPDTASQKRFEDCKILHVTPRPIYALPPFTPSDESSTTFMPLDFNFYNLAKRLPGPITGSAGRVPQAVREMLHGALQSTLGGDQSDLGTSALIAPEGDARGTVQVALSESYSEFVRSGLIEVLSGRVESLNSGERGCTAVVDNKGERSELDDIGAIIYATGYSAEPALSMLHSSTKSVLHFDANSMRLPIILEQWQTMSGRCANMAFIGFYEGPYWPIMEMQARLTAERWLGGTKLATKPAEEADKLLELRKAMRERDLDVPQYWFGDYAGYMEELASELQLRRNDDKFKEREGPVSPARYLTPHDNAFEAASTLSDLHLTWQACITGSYVPRAAFRALQGPWTIHRLITSSNSTLPSGTLTGTASFHRRDPTASSFDFEYLYLESGTFTTEQGFEMTASRRYVYRYAEAEDELSVWFVHPERELEVDYLFHNLKFGKPEDGKCVAKADHLCGRDMYWTEYRLPIKGVALRGFEVKHTVKGPSKEYVAVTRFERPVKEMK